MGVDTSKLVWLDLCSGLGGASQPALDRGWRVIRVDIDPRFRPDIVADVRALPLRSQRCQRCKGEGRYLAQFLDNHFTLCCGLCFGTGNTYWPYLKPTVLWASTVCTEFTKWGLRCFYPNPTTPDITLALAVRNLVRLFNPDCWFHENVRASRRFLNPIFGPPLCVTSGHVIWSNTLVLFPDIKPHKHNKVYRDGQFWSNRIHSRKKSFVGTGHNGCDSSNAAVIPYEIGEAICRAVERRITDAA